MDRRIAGTGSSPVLPTKSKRTRLWNRLRRLDREIWNLDKHHLYGFGKYLFYKDEDKIDLSKREILDQKRKEIRNRLKGYK